MVDLQSEKQNVEKKNQRRKLKSEIGQKNSISTIKINYTTYRSCNTNDTGGTPTAMSTLQSCSHDICVPGAVKGIVHTPLGQITSNVLLNWLVQLFAVDTISGTELFGHVKFAGIDIHSNDFGGTSHFGALDHSKALCMCTRFNVSQQK